MAQEGYTGVPEVSADEQAPNDYQHEEATPASFGAPLAEGGEALGQGIHQRADFYAKVAGDNATNNYLQETTALLHGDPSKQVMGPDGQMVPDTGYFGLRGANAMAARQDTSERLDEIAQEQAENLKDPVARLQFENDSRRYRAQFDVQIGTHADAEQRTWATHTNDTTAQINLGNAARNADNPIAAGAAQAQVRNAYVKNAELAGEDTQGAILKADQDVTLTRLRSLMVSNPPMAKDVFDKFGSVLASRPDYDQIYHQVQASVVNAEKAPFEDSLYSGALARATSRVGDVTKAPGATDIYSAIGGQEWSGKGPAPTSVNGAVGPSQIEPATAVQYGLDPTKLGDPVYAQHAKQVIIDHISALPNVQGDPARIAVGYFSGPGNIAPLGSPTPYIRDSQDGNGKSVSSYVADIQGRLNKYPSAADAINASIPAEVESARQAALAKFPESQFPGLADQVSDNVRRRLEQTASQTSRNAEVDGHIIQSAMGGNNPPISEDQLLAMGPQVASAYSRLQSENPMAANGYRNRFDANARGRAVGFGSGFKDYLDRTLAPSTDPTRITNPTEYNNFVGPGEDASLTNTGADQLTGLLSARGTPQGEAQAAQIKSFADQAYGNLTYSNSATGVRDQKGEAAYGRFMVQALPIIERAAKQGNLGAVLDPNSPDYLGKVAATFARPPAQMVRDRLSSEGIKQDTVFQAGIPAKASLAMAIQSKTITPEEGLWIGRKLGYIPGAAAPKPPGQAAAPMTHLPTLEH